MWKSMQTCSVCTPPDHRQVESLWRTKGAPRTLRRTSEKVNKHRSNMVANGSLDSVADVSLSPDVRPSSATGLAKGEMDALLLGNTRVSVIMLADIPTIQSAIKQPLINAQSSKTAYAERQSRDCAFRTDRNKKSFTLPAECPLTWATW